MNVLPYQANRRPRRVVALIGLLALAGLGLSTNRPAPAQADGPGVDQARATLEKWVETRRLISQEKRDWVLGRETLQDRITLVEREVETLRARIRTAEESVADADRRRAELLAENDALKVTSEGLANHLASLESRTGRLLARLPEPIRERVRPLSQRLPESGGQSPLALAERFQNLVGILNEVDKFNRTVTLVSEVRELGDGTTAEVTALYLGIGQGYYVGVDGQAGGVGAPTEAGWAWSQLNSAAPRILEVVQMQRNERLADFIQLPVRLAR